MRICPRCALISPDVADRCDCGFDFTTASSVVVERELAEAERNARRGAVRGLLIGLGALALSIGYQMATGHNVGLGFFFLFGFGGLALAGRSLNRIIDLRKAKREQGNPLRR